MFGPTLPPPAPAADYWSWNGETPAAPRAFHGGFDGEKFSGGWLEDLRAGPHSFAMDYPTLRSRSAQLFETNLYARGLLRRLVTNEVHTGLALEADPDPQLLGLNESELEGWGDVVESTWNAWATTPVVCDTLGRVEATFAEILAEARLESLIAGDVLIVLSQSSGTGLPTIQLIPGSRIQTPFLGSAAKITHGVELDSAGRQVAFHVATEDGKTTRIPAYGASTGRRVAWLMYGTEKRIDAVRGTPLLGLILQSLVEIDRFRDSTQRKAVINSLLAMWIEKGEDKISSMSMLGAAGRAQTVNDTDKSGQPRQWNAASQIPGIVIEELQHGEKPHAYKSDSGEANSFPAFEGALVSAIAWAYEMPPDILRLAFDRNYAASQAGLNEFKMYLSKVREKIANSFCRPIYEEWIIDVVALGWVRAPGLLESVANPARFRVLAGWTRADWVGSVKPVTDILKTVKAYEIAEAHGWITNTRIARELNGTKFATNARQIVKEREALPVRDVTTGEVTNDGSDDDESMVDPAGA